VTSSPSRPAGRERATLTGSIQLEGPYASARGIGIVLLSPLEGHAQARPVHAQIEQRNKEFRPSVLAIPVGSTISFPNTDPVFHNVFSLSPAQKFDLGLYKQGSKDVQFNKAGVVRLLCNLHAAMNGYIVIHDEPYAVMTDRAGRFHITGLPPGRYRARFWHERAREMTTRELTLEAGRNDVTVPVRADVGRDLGTDKEGQRRGPKSQS
jgi:plastocyanin